MQNVFWRRRDNIEPLRRAEPSGADAIRIVVVTRDPDEWHSLHAIAGAENWMLLWAHSSQMAREIVVRYHVPVVICDRDLPNEDWRRILCEMADLRPPVRTLVAAESANEELRREVVQHRGLEILTKPFNPQLVARIVRLAATVL
jgi:DNA-binding response OmpR family regulator